MRKPMTENEECDHCEVAGRAEAIWWGGFLLGVGVGVGSVVMLMIFGWVKP
jgi:hypothetical protein